MTTRSNQKLGLALTTAIACAALPAFADEDSAWRLFVADHAEASVSVVDAIAGETIATFETAGPATLHRSESGRTVFAVQGAAGRVQAFATGLEFHDHGDHADIEIADPAPIDFGLDGERPAHFVERQGLIAQWFDGESEARFLGEAALLTGAPDIRTAFVEAPHHGVAVPYQDHAVVTIPNAEDASQRPVGARIVDFDGNREGEDVACPGLHGSAGSGDLYALACDTGLLVISQERGAPRIRHVPYGENLPEGSASTLIGGRGMQYFVGNYGPDRILVAEPSEAGDSFELVQLQTRRVHFAVDPVRPRNVYVFTEDGTLHRIDVVGASITGSVRLTAPYSMDGHWSDPRPRIAVAGDEIVVTDPLEGVLHLVDAGSFEKTRQIEVEGTPFNIVAVGGSGRTHGHD